MALWRMSHHPPPGGEKDPLDPEPSQHAFVMLGEQTLFLCHLTMFHMQEHMFQIVLRASLPEDAWTTYLKHRKDHPLETYFLGNNEGDQTTVFSIHTGERTSFIADIFLGIPYKRVYEEWPWKGQTPVIGRVPLTIEREVYYRHFDFNLGYPDTLTYLVFGRGTEAHMTHYQVKEPDFDHILSVAKVPEWMPKAALESGIHVNFPGLRSTDPVYCGDPFPNKEYQVQYAGQPGTTYPLTVGPSYWQSAKIVNNNNPCPDVPPLP